MTLPGLSLSTTDGNLGLLSAEADKILVIGPAASGTDNVILPYAQPSDMISTHGRGQGVTCGAHILDFAGGEIDFAKCATSVAAATSSISQTGGGPTISIGAGTPNDFYDVQLTIVTGGALGAATFKYSLDGGQTVGLTRTVPAGGSYVIPNTGWTITFAAGAYVADEVYSWTGTPATFDAADIDAVKTALLGVNTRWKAVVYAGSSATASAAATIATAVGADLDALEADFRMLRGLVHAGEEAEAAVRTAFEAIEHLKLAVFSGKDRIAVANPIEGWQKPQLPSVYNAAAMVAAFTRGTNIGWVGNGFPPRGGRKPLVSAISFDEYKSGETLHDINVNASRTHIGKNGYYFVNGLLKTPAGSDFRYLHWGLAFDRAVEVTLDALTPYINASLKVRADGTGRILPREALRIDKQANKQLREAVLKPLNEQGQEGYVSAAKSAVDQTYDILTNKKFRADLRVVPDANTEGIELTAGLFAALADDSSLSTETTEES